MKGQWVEGSIHPKSICLGQSRQDSITPSLQRSQQPTEAHFQAPSCSVLLCPRLTCTQEQEEVQEEPGGAFPLGSCQAVRGSGAEPGKAASSQLGVPARRAWSSGLGQTHCCLSGPSIFLISSRPSMLQSKK